MSRPRKNFFIRFDELSKPGEILVVGDIISVPYPGKDILYTILKIHPKRGGVTARKAT